MATAEGLPAGAAELRSWVVVSIISGHGFYDTTLSRRRLAQELVAACERVLGAPATSPRGFGGVSIDEIGREVGVVGPALYRYFDTKADLFVAAVAHLHEWQALEAERALRTPGPDEAVIAELVRSYVRLALAESPRTTTHPH